MVTCRNWFGKKLLIKKKNKKLPIPARVGKFSWNNFFKQNNKRENRQKGSFDQTSNSKFMLHNRTVIFYMTWNEIFKRRAIYRFEQRRWPKTYIVSKIQIRRISKTDSAKNLSTWFLLLPLEEQFKTKVKEYLGIFFTYGPWKKIKQQTKSKSQSLLQGYNFFRVC